MAFRADPDAIYFTDNGALLCGRHLGATAEASGRDISGQKIQKVTPIDAVVAKREHGMDLKCETCGALPLYYNERTGAVIDRNHRIVKQYEPSAAAAK